MKNVHKALKHPQGKLLVVFALLIIALFTYYFYAMSKRGAVSTATVEVSDTDHVRGAVGAKATLVEFGDFQCPACGAYEPLVRKVLADHKDTLAVVFRHFPLTQIHQNALLAAKASEAAGLQGKFWEMHDMLYDKQGEWSATLNARDFMISYAKVLKLDTQKFSTDLGSDAIEKKVLAEYQEGVKLGLMGTPTFFLNGKQLTDIKSAQDFEQAVANVTK
jgi:protein-disulfide isomerase